METTTSKNLPFWEVTYDPTQFFLHDVYFSPGGIYFSWKVVGGFLPRNLNMFVKLWIISPSLGVNIKNNKHETPPDKKQVG